MQPKEFYRRRLPHIHPKGATLFVTFRLRKGKLSNEEVLLVRNYIVSGADKYYFLRAVTVMPDHVHLLLKPKEGYSMPRILGGIKGNTAKKINRRRGRSGALWQDESYDRIIRGEKDLLEKLDYMLTNPLKKELVKDPWEYPGWYLNRMEE